jgi:hypothetical protein
MNDIKRYPNDEIYLSILRHMTPEQKLAKVFELNEIWRERLNSRLRKKYPMANEPEIKRIAIQRIMAGHYKRQKRKMEIWGRSKVQALVS